MNPSYVSRQFEPLNVLTTRGTLRFSAPDIRDDILLPYSLISFCLVQKLTHHEPA